LNIYFLNSRYGELNSVVNEEKQKYNECIRSIEALKRQINQNMESEKIKVNSLVLETKDLISVSANEKIDRVRDELMSRIRDLEKAISDELDHKTKYLKNVKETSDIKLDGLKRYIDDEIKMNRDEIKDANVKTLESVKVLNDGLNLIEKQNEERTKRFEKVISAEIKLR
jgi:hypothetical protein